MRATHRLTTQVAAIAAAAATAAVALIAAAGALGGAAPAAAQQLSSGGSSAGVGNLGGNFSGVAEQLAAALPDRLPTDHLGRPNAELLAQARTFANQPFIPAEVRSAVLSAVAFYEGTGESGVDLVEGGPVISQFYWPTVSGGCIGAGAGDSVGAAIAVPGPTDIPAPGAGAGQTTFLFTALGTTPAAQAQGEMAVHWFNLATLRGGVTPLENHGINPDGPATISGTADTGFGTIVAVVAGNVHTQDASCAFIPTADVFSVR